MWALCDGTEIDTCAPFRCNLGLSHHISRLLKQQLRATGGFQCQWTDKCQGWVKWGRGGGAHMLSVPTPLSESVSPDAFLKMHLQM